MGREIRKVPPNWQHPKKYKYTIEGLEEVYIPLHNRNYQEECNEWVIEFNKWQKGENPEIQSLDDFIDWYGNCPEKEEYIHYSESEATWFQVYETVSEGTPTTPPFATENELIEHLVKFGESYTKYNKSFSREVAEKFVRGSGYVPSMIVTNGVITESINCAGLL